VWWCGPALAKIWAVIGEGWCGPALGMSWAVIGECEVWRWVVCHGRGVSSGLGPMIVYIFYDWIIAFRHTPEMLQTEHWGPLFTTIGTFCWMRTKPRAHKPVWFLSLRAFWAARKFIDSEQVCLRSSIGEGRSCWQIDVITVDMLHFVHFAVNSIDQQRCLRYAWLSSRDQGLVDGGCRHGPLGGGFLLTVDQLLLVLLGVSEWV